MTTTRARLAADPLWQCLCPLWPNFGKVAPRLVVNRARQPLQPLCFARCKSDAEIQHYASRAKPDLREEKILGPLAGIARVAESAKPIRIKPGPTSIDYRSDSTQTLYDHLRSAAVDSDVRLCRFVAQLLVRERGERPSLLLYNALIRSNTSHDQGAAWKVDELLEQMQQDGIKPDIHTCHAVLKVLSVHVDHLLRADILEYMRRRWFELSEDGHHDVVSGLLREGLFEEALHRLDLMRERGLNVQSWLLDMAVYILCRANEISEAYRIMRLRYDHGELNISRSVWMYFLDKAAEARHHTATTLAWSSQVNLKYLQPSSGICLNVLATAARAADAVMATEVFTHLSKRGTAFQAIHYELLISTYLAAKPPDVKRAISILTIMALEKLEPTVHETRSLYLYLRAWPMLIPQALTTLRELHDQGRTIPIAALNLLIECYVHNRNLPEALKIYKQIHTFVPAEAGAKKTYANIDTFNLLLKGCRTTSPPDAQQASFLVSELLALRVVPTALTFDRLILVFVWAGMRAIESARESASTGDSPPNSKSGAEFIDWAMRHFEDMQALGWMPRFGTLEDLSVQLARLGDARCWDVLQAAEDGAKKVDGWQQKGHWARKNVERAWEKWQVAESELKGEGVAGDAAEVMSAVTDFDADGAPLKEKAVAAQ